MDHKTIKHLEKNRRKSPWPTVRPTVLRHDTKRTIHEEKNDKLNLLKFKNLKKKNSVKDTCQENEMTGYRPKENICKS